MLVLSRKETEEIVIGESIVIKVVRISGGRVAIGVEAPGMPIDRSEVRDSKTRVGLKLVRGHGTGGRTPPSPKGSGKAA